ncbi:hypothetical protein [Helicobacter rodentium]|uniref:hypothetical protein n=1 Tax=Helicobacter rodentium TaxID=59617 RepID=UPI0023F3EA34|nr:hypothetical protein [Helicobacter rodentium]
MSNLKIALCKIMDCRDSASAESRNDEILPLQSLTKISSYNEFMLQSTLNYPQLKATK